MSLCDDVVKHPASVSKTGHRSYRFVCQLAHTPPYFSIRWEQGKRLDLWVRNGFEPLMSATHSAFRNGDAVILYDRRAKKHLVILEEGKRVQVAGGAFDCDDLIGKGQGARIKTHRGGGVSAYLATLEDYVLLMPRAAAVMPPKDIAYVLQWADVFPGSHVVEAGIGSGGLTIGLLEAVGSQGRVTSFDLREDHAKRALKNIEGWRGNLGERLDFRLADVGEGLTALDAVDRIVFDLPEPWSVLSAVEGSLKPGGIWVSYLPTIRQVDQLVLALMDARSFTPPDVVEILHRPWVADKVRLRPELTMVGHSGFLVRTRRRGEFHEETGSLERAVDDKNLSND